MAGFPEFTRRGGIKSGNDDEHGRARELVQYAASLNINLHKDEINDENEK